MKKSAPYTARLAARVAFLSALAKWTPAIRELRQWPRPSVAPSAAPEGRFRTAVQLRGPHAVLHWFPVHVEEFLTVAGDARFKAARHWAEKWNLADAGWLVDWAVLAMFAWDLAVRCQRASCPSGCDLARSGRATDALQLVASPLILRRLMRDRERVWTLVEVTQGKHYSSISWDEPDGFEPVVSPILGPHPLLETKEEFSRRCEASWAEAVLQLADSDAAAALPRKLDLHCKWLVRSRVLNESAVTIVGGKKTSPSTVLKAVKVVSTLVDLPTRADRRRAT